MPPKEKVTEAQIMNTALGIVKEKGIGNLNARDLAKEMGCSVHPIFRVFNSMDGLKAAVYKMAEQVYNQNMLSPEDHEGGEFLGMGLNYINFAKREQNLFKLLFMSDAFQNQSLIDIVGNTEGDDEVIGMLCSRTGLSATSSKELYAGIWLTTHGIAAMFATNSCRYNDEEIKRLLNNSFNGLVMKLKKDEETNI